MTMSCSSRLNGMAPDGRRRSWFHQSLEQLSQGLSIKFGSIASLVHHSSNHNHSNINNRVKVRKKNVNKKANRCSSWFVEPYRPSSTARSSLFILRRPISEESLDFFDRFATLKERADRPRAAARRHHQRQSVEEAFSAVHSRHNVLNANNIRESNTSPTLSEESSSATLTEDVDIIPQPAPRSRGVKSRTSQWIWGPELLIGPEADKVYVEALYSLAHAITGLKGGSKAEEIHQYVQRAFQFSDDKHLELVQSARQRPAPDVVLNLGVIQARNLKGKDVNGMSDPYCSASTSNLNRQNTSVKERTLNPVWNETLQFSVKDVNEDVLQLEIWDYDPDETVKEKMSRIGEVKDLRGMGILLKQIAVSSKTSPSSASTGKPGSHQFLGQLHVPLKLIPLTGIERWYPLEGRDRSTTKERGEIRLCLTLTASRTDVQPLTVQQSYIQYERLLRIVIETELKGNANWRGALPEPASVMLRQMAAHQGLKSAVTDVCTWAAYSAACHKRVLDFGLILNLLQRIKKALPEELVNTFWAAADSMANAALSALRHVRSHPELHGPQLSALLECLKELNVMGQTSRPSSWTDLKKRIVEVVTMSAADCYSRTVACRRKGGDICDDDRLENSIRVCQTLMSDLKAILTNQQDHFVRIWDVNVFSLVYLYYDGQLAGSIKPVVDSITRALKTIKTSEDQMVKQALEASGEVDKSRQRDDEDLEDNPAYPLTMGTALFELYLSLQQFQKMSAGLGTAANGTKLEHFYGWFSPSVSRWLDIALYKALMRIGKAVNLDTLATVDALVKHSSSAVDTVTVFYQIKTFWEQLAWPDAEGAMAFVLKIIDDVSRCSLFYAEAMRLKMERLHPAVENESFFISLKLCAAINSILHVRQSIEPLAEGMGVSQLGQINNNDAVNLTSKNLMENAVDNINAKLEEVFNTIARRMEWEVAKLINAVLDSDFGALARGRLSGYLYDQLSTLNTQLDIEVFEQVLHVIHQRILQKFLDVVLGDIDNKRQPPCFNRWGELLKIINDCFCGPDVAEELTDEVLTKIRWLLKLHGAETVDLVHLYRLERIKQQEELPSTAATGFGSLTVRAVFIGNELTIEVLNGRNLKPMDTSGSSDPYVKIQLLPVHQFPDAAELRTKVHKNTLFPLFDESFTYQVPLELQTNPDCFVLFTVKDKDLIGTNEMIGEAFLTFRQIARCDADTAMDTKDLDQIILPLTVASNQESEYLTVLEGRTWDKAAREFVKKERKRMVMTTSRNGGGSK